MGLVPDLLNPADVDETPLKRETPRALSIRLARAKAERALEMPLVRAQGANVFGSRRYRRRPGSRRILPKAETEEQARDCLSLLSGCLHWVYSTICLASPGGKFTTRCVETKLRFKRLSRASPSTATSPPMSGTERPEAMPSRAALRHSSVC